MSNESDPTTEKPAKPVRRFGTGALSLLQVACVTVLFVAVNYLGSQHYVPKDLSADSAYTLSSATQRYLQSPAVKDRAELLVIGGPHKGGYKPTRAKYLKGVETFLARQ